MPKPKSQPKHEVISCDQYLDRLAFAVEQHGFSGHEVWVPREDFLPLTDSHRCSGVDVHGRYRLLFNESPLFWVTDILPTSHHKIPRGFVWIGAQGQLHRARTEVQIYYFEGAQRGPRLKSRKVTTDFEKSRYDRHIPV